MRLMCSVVLGHRVRYAASVQAVNIAKLPEL